MTGAWQGTVTVRPGDDRRTVFKISRADDGAYERTSAADLAARQAQTAWTIPEPPAPPKRMAANADPTFEVATIKPTNPGTQGRGFRISGWRFTGGPAWAESDKFDLAAQPDGEGLPNNQQWKGMLEKLLADRFQLTFHHEQKELAVYAIVVAKNGPKLTRSEGDPNGPPALFFAALATCRAGTRPSWISRV